MPASELEVLREEIRALRLLVDERDRRYQERHEEGQRAVASAFSAAKDLTSAAFASSEKAIAKAEENAEKWRANANEWRTAMNDRELKFAPRQEMDQRIRSLEEKIADVKTAQAIGGGSDAGGKAVIDTSRANLALVVSAIGMLVVLWKLFQ